MVAGLMTEKIDILRKLIRVNEYSEEIEEWIVLNSTRAYLKHQKGNVGIENHENQPSYTKQLIVWNYVDVDDYDRVKWNNKFYSVLSIEPDRENNNKTITVQLVNE